MRIGELARRVGVSTDAVRLYEQIGLVRSVRLPNGYRDYPPGAQEMLQYVKTAQRLGFTLAEISENIPRVLESDDPGPALAQVFQDKARMIQQRIDELTALQAGLLARAHLLCPLTQAPPEQAQAETTANAPGNEFHLPAHHQRA